MIVKKNFFRLILNFDIALSMFLKADRVIITNDGTQGDKALAAIRKSSIKNLRFYVNGVDRHNMSHTPIEKSLIDGFDYKYLSICVTRLVSIKRVDLSVKVIAEVVNNLKLADFGLVIVGDGVERQNLENLANSLGIREHILFLGSVDNNLVKSCLSKADLFLSTYDVSNVGNPLLEAIRMNKVIFTRNNGDTSFWIDHYVNGFIYDDKDIVEDMARDIVKLLDDNKLKEKIIRNIKLTEEKLLHTWTERLSLEFSDIDMFLSKERSK
jgi:glycosyltransferase involved in cell wall biosynthesis